MHWQTQTMPQCAQPRCSRASPISVQGYLMVPCGNEAPRSGQRSHAEAHQLTCLCRHCPTHALRRPPASGAECSVRPCRGMLCALFGFSVFRFSFLHVGFGSALVWVALDIINNLSITICNLTSLIIVIIHVRYRFSF